jgi:rubrerythrin
MSRTHGDRSDKDNKIRLLKKQVDSLRREVAQLRKENNKLRESANATDFEGDSDVDFVEDDKKARKRGEGLPCEECHKGTYMPFTLSLRGGDRTYWTCGVCGHRKTKK